MKSKTILVAYKDGPEARSICTFFHDVGYTVEIAGAVSQMIRTILNGDIRVLLIDDQVAGIKVHELSPVLRRINRRVQVIVISSEESLEVARQLRGAGIFYQAMKPVDLDELKSAVESAFRKIERENLKEGLFSFFAPSGVLMFCNR